MVGSGTKSLRRRWLTHYAPLVIWTLVILGLGGPMGSMNETSRIIRPLLEFLFPTALPETISFLHGLIRKSAHFVEYGVLGFLATRVFGIVFKNAVPKFSYALALVAAIASIDEYQQSFNPARTGSPVDVLIDLAGAAAAILVCILAARDNRRSKVRRRAR